MFTSIDCAEKSKYVQTTRPISWPKGEPDTSLTSMKRRNHLLQTPVGADGIDLAEAQTIATLEAFRDCKRRSNSAAYWAFVDR